MTKQELVEAVHAQAGDGLTKKVTADVVDAVFRTVASNISAGGKVALAGFGTFTVKVRAARQGRNPRTKDPIDLPATKVVGFKAASSLKDSR